MQVIREKHELRKARANVSGIVTLVPTMGALHAGHRALMERARLEAGSEGTVVVSIFVNPTQFNNPSDLESYPSTFEADRALCEAAGVDIIYAPKTNAVYESDASISVTETLLSNTLCGATRPGHFDGVCTVILKLYNLVQPDAMIFGEKDFQQVAVIERLVRDLDIPVQIVPVGTVREESGLALSSRNLRLSAKAHEEAPVVQRSLQAMAQMLANGELDPSQLISHFETLLAPLETETKVDYLELVDAETMQVKAMTDDRKGILAVAVFFGKIRLIDHVSVPVREAR